MKTWTDPNGANLRVVLDAAPKGQRLPPTKTQGGASACPGLWDKAPLGLDLEPFGTDPLLMHSLTLLRGTLEAFAVRLVRQRADWPEIKLRLSHLVGQLRTHALKNDLGAFHATDRDFHHALVAAADLPVLLDSWRSVADNIDGWILGIQRDYWPNLMDLYREHVYLLEALVSGDEAVAGDALAQHLESGWHRRAVAGGRALCEVDPVQRAIFFLSAHYASKVDIAWLARHVCFVSEAHLIRRFRASHGITPHAYLIRQRLEHAAKHLRGSNDSVAVIARQVGYRNFSHFVRSFRNHFGVTPLAYRRQDWAARMAREVAGDERENVLK
jgi:AraC-like DNA-binding protein